MSVVEFPGLWGLRFTISRTAFEVFGISIYWYGIIIAIAFLIAMLLAMRDSGKFGFEPDNIIDLVLYAAPVTIIFARLYYVIFSWEEFKYEPLQIFNTRRGGLAIYGGIIGALLVAWIFGKKKKISVLRLFDFYMPYFALGQAIGRWGNFINQEAFGTNTTLPWGMTSDTIRKFLTDLSKNTELLDKLKITINPDRPVHPTFLYESLWDLGVFLFLIWYRKRLKVEGEVFFLYMILYGVGRFWIEALRTDSLMLGNLRVSQLLALLFAISLSIAFYARRKKASETETMDVIGTSRYGEILKKIKNEEEGAKEEEASAFKESQSTQDKVFPEITVYTEHNHENSDESIEEKDTSEKQQSDY